MKAMKEHMAFRCSQLVPWTERISVRTGSCSLKTRYASGKVLRANLAASVADDSF